MTPRRWPSPARRRRPRRGGGGPCREASSPPRRRTDQRPRARRHRHRHLIGAQGGPGGRHRHRRLGGEGEVGALPHRRSSWRCRLRRPPRISRRPKRLLRRRAFFPGSVGVAVVLSLGLRAGDVFVHSVAAVYVCGFNCRGHSTSRRGLCLFRRVCVTEGDNNLWK